MDYERIASDALLETAADRREDLLRDVAVRAKAAVAFGAGKAYRIPHDQHDWPTAQFLAALLLEHGVEIQQADNGDYWIPMAQPYSRFLVEMLEPQRYPEVRLQPGKDILRPYDVATWTLPLAMGVTVEQTTMAGGKRTQAASRRSRPQRRPFSRSTQAQPKPRIAIYNPWGGALDEGWTRWLLDQYGFAPKSLHPQEVKAGLQNFDVFILPDIEKDEIASGRRARRRRIDAATSDELPPEYRGALEKEGADGAARRSSKTAGRCSRSAPAATTSSTTSTSPCATRWRSDRPTSPSPARSCACTSATIIRSPRGCRRRRRSSSITRSRSRRRSPGNEMQRWVLATYPDDARDILLSGWIAGEEQADAQSRRGGHDVRQRPHRPPRISPAAPRPDPRHVPDDLQRAVLGSGVDLPNKCTYSARSTKSASCWCVSHPPFPLRVDCGLQTRWRLAPLA